MSMMFDVRGTMTQMVKGCRSSTDCTANMYMYRVCETKLSGGSVICTTCHANTAAACQRPATGTQYLDSQMSILTSKYAATY